MTDDSEFTSPFKIVGKISRHDNREIRPTKGQQQLVYKTGDPNRVEKVESKGDGKSTMTAYMVIHAEHGAPLVESSNLESWSQSHLRRI